MFIVRYVITIQVTVNFSEWYLVDCNRYRWPQLQCATSIPKHYIRMGHAAPKVYLPRLHSNLSPSLCYTKVSYIGRPAAQNRTCRAGQVRVLFCLPDCHFLPNSLATGQVVLLHAELYCDAECPVSLNCFPQSLSNQLIWCQPCL